MNNEKEAVASVYKDKELVAIIKRDEKSKKNIVYVVKEADIDEILGLIEVEKNVPLV